MIQSCVWSMNNETKKEIQNGWKHGLQPPTSVVIRNKVKKKNQVLNKHWCY